MAYCENLHSLQVGSKSTFQKAVAEYSLFFRKNVKE